MKLIEMTFSDRQALKTALEVVVYRAGCLANGSGRQSRDGVSLLEGAALTLGALVKRYDDAEDYDREPTAEADAAEKFAQNCAKQKREREGK